MSRISFATSQTSSTDGSSLPYNSYPSLFPYTSANPGTQASYAPYMTPAQYGAYISSKFNGFPFPVFEKDIEGNPFGDWDKETRLGGYSWGYPSKKTNTYIPVLGIPEYSYSFTREQLIKAYWRVLGGALVVNDTNNLSGSFKSRQGINLLKTSEDKLTPEDLSNPQIKGISIEEWEAENPPFCYDYGYGEECFENPYGPSTLEGKEDTLLETNKGSYAISLKTGTDFADSNSVGSVQIDFSHAVLKVGENDYRPYVKCNGFCTPQYPSFSSIHKYAALSKNEQGIGCKCPENTDVPPPHVGANPGYPRPLEDNRLWEFNFIDGSRYIVIDPDPDWDLLDTLTIQGYQKGPGFYSTIHSKNNWGYSYKRTTTPSFTQDEGNIVTLSCNENCHYTTGLKSGEKLINYGTSPCYCEVVTTSDSTAGSSPCPSQPDHWCTDNSSYANGDMTLDSPGGAGESTVKGTIEGYDYCCQSGEVEDCCTKESLWTRGITLWESESISDFISHNSISDQFFQAYKNSTYGSSYGTPYRDDFNAPCNPGGFELSASITKTWSNSRPELNSGGHAPFSESATTYSYEISPKVKSKLLVSGPIENCYIKVWVALIKRVQQPTGVTTSIESITPYVINASPANGRGCSPAVTDCLTITSDTDQSNLFVDAGVEFELDPSTFEILDVSSTLSPELNSSQTSYSVSKEYRIIKYSLDPNWEPPHRVVNCTSPELFRIFPEYGGRNEMDKFSKPLSQSEIAEWNASIDEYIAENCD
jgi:hypothetical protein